MPDVFQSSARVYVDTRSKLQPLLTGIAIQQDPRQEIRTNVKTLLSRPNLEIIARESDLDITAKTPIQYENLITSLSKNIKIRPVGREFIYTISYNHRNPEMAKTIVQETLDLFVEGSKGDNRRDSDGASQFIDEQISDYENRLAAAEQRLANFKRKHSDLLPNQGSFHSNYRLLQEQLEFTELNIQETEQQIVVLSSRLSNKKTQKDGFSVRSANEEPALTTRYDSRITSLEEKLDELMLKFTELHPDVIETSNLLESLIKARKKEIEEYLNSETSDDNLDDRIGSLNNEIRLEISRLEGQLASFRVRQTRFSEKIEELRQKIDMVPQAEAEQTSLNRDYEILKRKYEELLSRKEASDIAVKADVSNEDVQFRVIDPPIAPQTPTGPNRILNYTLVLLAAFATGLGVAFLISQLNPILIRGSQLTLLTGYPVLGTVSHLDKPQMNRVSRKKLFVFILSSLIICGMYAGLVTAEVLQLDLRARIFS
jgi:polysaccharide chain length determinant protein (PEP-CTERM system associated)